MHDVFGLCQCAAQYFSQWFELRFNVLLTLKLRQSLPQPTACTLIGFIKRIKGGLNRACQCLGVGEATVLGVDVFPFIELWRQLVEFTNLPGQALALALQTFLRVTGIQQCFLRKTPVAPLLRQLLVRYTPIRIQQVAHRIGSGQALPGMLTMDID